MRGVSRSGWEGRRRIGADVARRKGQPEPAVRFHNGFAIQVRAIGSRSGANFSDRPRWYADADVRGLPAGRPDLGSGALLAEFAGRRGVEARAGEECEQSGELTVSRTGTHLSCREYSRPL